MLFTLLVPLAQRLAAQIPPDLERERAEFAEWLRSAPVSPFAIVALQPIGPGISIGYEPSDIPLPIPIRGFAREERGLVAVEVDGRRLALPRERIVDFEGFRLVASGPPGRAAIAVYGGVRGFEPPSYYPYNDSLAMVVALEPPERRGVFLTLGPEGAETQATEAGFVRVRTGAIDSRLRVYRLGGPDDEEAELLIFFRDGSSGHGSYPAGRFVVLSPGGTGQYRLDLNRARNPFCAYNSVYPCPAPWPGNSIESRIKAGETYRPRGAR
ncbi:MAG TPA: DUF1684 domain-containing protein [Gemmatimonadales bacterium]